MEYYAAIKNDEFVSFVGTWMNVETIILSKRTQEQKIKHHILTHRRVLNNENTWTQRTEHHTLGSTYGGYGRDSGREGREGIMWGEMSDIGDGGMVATNHIAMNVPMQQSCMICSRT